MEKLYTFNKNKTRIWLWLRSWTPYYQIQTQIEECGETARPFRYDLNQIPYDYTVEVRNRFKGLDLRDRVPDELWTEIRDIVQETGIKITSKKKEMQKGKMVVWGGLTNTWEKKRIKGKREKERYLNAEFQRIARRDKKAFLCDQCKEIEESNRMGKTRAILKKN